MYVTTDLYKIKIKMENFFNNNNILNLIFKWKWHLIVIFLLSVVIAVIFSGPTFITPKFRSFAVVYPSNLVPFSSESQTEQMNQYLESQEIVDSMISKYDLGIRYMIDSTKKAYRFKVVKEYWNDVNIDNTEYESIEIEVLDKNPDTATLMVQDILYFYNNLVLSSHRKKYKETYCFLVDHLNRKLKEIDSVKSELHILNSEYEIFDYPNQSREISRGFLKTVDGDNSKLISEKDVLRWKNNIQEKGVDFVFFNDRYYDLVEEYGKAKRDIDEILKNMNRELTYYTYITRPFPADKKEFPKRSIIIAFFSIATLLLSFIIILFLENFRMKLRKD